MLAIRAIVIFCYSNIEVIVAVIIITFISTNMLSTMSVVSTTNDW